MKYSIEKYKHLIKLFFSSVLVIGVGLIYAYVWIGYYNRYILQDQYRFFRRGNWVIVLLYIVLLIFFMHTYGGFKIGYLKNGNLIYSQMIALFFSNMFAYFQIAVIDKRFVSPVYILLMTFVEALFIVLWTLLFQLIYRKLFPPRRMLFIAGDRHDYHLRDKINSREDKYEICAAVSYRLGKEKISTLISQYDGVIIGDIPSHHRNQIVKYCFEIEKRSYSVPKISDVLLRSSDQLTLFDTPLLLSRNLGLSVEQQILKRIEDVVVALLISIIFSPIFLIAAFAIKCTDGGAVFYKQERLTKDGKIFMIYKFRTMVADAERMSGPVLASENDPRITLIGKFLRATRFDEVPQIINIIKGEMSIVGPRPERPLLASEIKQSIPEFDYRLKVKAGLTGYAQIYGKYNTTAYDKLKLDLTYIRNYSILLDIKLILMTPKIMFMKESTEGIGADTDIPSGVSSSVPQRNDEQKVKVLHVLKSSVYSGAENIAIMIIKGLEKHYEFAYLATDGEIKNVLKQEHIKHFLLAKYSRKSIQAVIKEYEPDIVHAHDFMATVICATLTGSFKLISHLHYDPPWVRSWNVKTITYSLCFSRIKKVLAVSGKVMEQMVFADKFKMKTIVVKNPVDAARINEKAHEGAVPDKYASDLLFVGRFVEQKDPEAFIRLVSNLKTGGMPEISARMLGEGELLKKCQELITLKGLENNIVLSGFQSNPYKYMKQTRVLCMTSKWEGFGLVLAEAGALGIPVLSTRTSGACDVLGNDSWALCDNIAMMEQKAKDLLSDRLLYERESFKAAERTNCLTDLKTYISKISALYAEEVD